MPHEAAPNQSRGTPPARLFIWNGEILYLGTANIPLRAHKVVQEKFLLCLEGEFRLPDQHGRWVSSRSCLIGNGVRLDRSLIDGRGTVIAMVYLIPFSQDYPALASQMSRSTPGIYYDHPMQHQLITELTQLRDRTGPLACDPHSLLKGLMIPAALRDKRFRSFDPRVLAAASHIRSNMEDNLGLSGLAANTGLSRSRFEKLFKDQTGVPVTSYRTRCRVFTAVVLLGIGYSITEAAMMTGFSSTAHFSRLFSSINGFSPSSVFHRDPQPDIFVDPDTASAALAQSRELIII